jgi:hypothetical protein
VIASTSKSKLGLSLLLGMVTIAMVTVLLVALPTTEVQSRGSGCEGDVKIEGSSADYTAPSGKSIDYICIKAGKNIFTFQCGETDASGCYSIKWTEDGEGCCSAVTIGGGGTGRDCKSISHTAVTFSDGDCKKDPPKG